MVSPNTLRIQRPIGERVRVPDTVQVRPALKPIEGRNRRVTPLLVGQAAYLPRSTPQRKRALKALRRTRRAS